MKLRPNLRQMETTKKFKNLKVVKASGKRGGSSKLPSILLNKPIDAQIELNEIYTGLKKEQSLLKAILKKLEREGLPVENIYEELEDPQKNQIRKELIIEGFLQNLASTGSFCYFRKVVLNYTDELDYFYIIKGAQVNVLTFEQGPYEVGDKSCPYYKK